MKLKTIILLQGLQRNNQCFKKALLVLKDDSDFDSALAFMKTWNQNNDSPLPDYEVEACVRSAKNTIDNKDESIQLILSQSQNQYSK